MTSDFLKDCELTYEELTEISAGGAPSWFWLVQPVWDALRGIWDSAKNDPYL